MKKDKKKGFTLVELVVVLVILAILMAILVPSLIGYINKSKKTACDVNMNYTYKALMAEYVTQYAKGKDGLTKDDIDKVMTKDMEGNVSGSGYADICPSGGIYTVEADKNNFTITCSVHGEGENSHTTPVTDKNVDSIWTASDISRYFLSADGTWIGGSRTSLDSTGANFGLKAKDELLKTLGLDPDSYDFRIYSNNGTNYKLYISPSLKDYKAGDPITVTGYQYTYDKDTKKWTRSNTGTTQTMKVKTSSLDGKDFLVLDTEKYDWSAK
ncbi:MAG: prepilin-type N-terminal cleavage/methylation domain-containing protein [Blautia sp.]|jgi:prepilin-type N-terminal cleavage/methylation domain-containing protein